MTIIKNIILAICLIALVLFLARTFLPENAIRIGSGFQRYTPAISYPMKLAFLSAFIYLICAYFFEGKKLLIGYVILIGLNLTYLFYCLKTYVESN
ncbi:MAG: hypothetical protein AB8F94_08985 [Saprospiraceae bacterium]